jgi:hypothetical protein
VTAVLFVIAAFFVGLFLGALVSAARDYSTEQGDNDAYRDELVRQWRDGYGHGWTTGRVRLVEEQRSQSTHPTRHPLAEVRRLLDQDDV